MARLWPLPKALTIILGVLTATAVASHDDAADTCAKIQGKISSASDVIYPTVAAVEKATGLTPYAKATQHFFQSSSDAPACVVRLASDADVSAVLRIVGASRTPFAVYSGGHASNPGFSSTRGVHISLERLDQIRLAEDKKTVTVGFGLGWIDVYKALEPHGLNVVGGRVIGPHVGGFTLGGGYSWKTNQHGLTCDSVKTFHVVLPNGTITTASKNNHRDLFFALKGGLNRFGIVTAAELYTHPQPPKVYGGLRLYTKGSVAAALNATSLFTYQNKDPKASIITTLGGGALGPYALVIFFYDGPEKPPSFDLFDGLPTDPSTPLTVTADNVGQKDFVGFMNSIPSYLAKNIRGTFATLSTSALPPRFLEAVKEQAESIGALSAAHGGTTINFDIEPFTAYGQHATDSAYPHADSPLPLNVNFAWADAAEDEWWYGRLRDCVAALKRVALQEGVYAGVSTAYPNYALADTTALELYGARNAARLTAIRDRIDPDRVMDLAGGFVI